MKRIEKRPDGRVKAVIDGNCVTVYILNDFGQRGERWVLSMVVDLETYERNRKIIMSD